MQPWRRAVTRTFDIKWHRIRVLCITDIASSHRGHYASILNGFEKVTIQSHRTYFRVTERQIEDVSAMFQSKLQTIDNLSVRAIARVVQHPDSHDLSSRSDASLSASVALSCNNTSHMCAMAILIHRVVVIIYAIISVMRKLWTAIPHASGNVDMVVIHSGINDSHNHAIAIIARRAVVAPHRRSINFIHVPSDISCLSDLCFNHIRHHLTHLISINVSHIRTFLQLSDNIFRSVTAEAIERPILFNAAHVTFQTIKKIHHILL